MILSDALFQMQRLSNFDYLSEDDVFPSIEEIISAIDTWVLSQNNIDNIEKMACRILSYYCWGYCDSYEELFDEGGDIEEDIDGDIYDIPDLTSRRVFTLILLLLELYDLFIIHGVDLCKVWEKMKLPGSFDAATWNYRTEIPEIKHHHIKCRRKAKFSDYLQIEDTESIINKLRLLPSDLPPKIYGAVITVMINKGIMRPIADGERSAIYHALCRLYTDGRNIGTRQAVTKYICKEPLSDLDIASAEGFLR